jgi:hypothetical protein
MDCTQSREGVSHIKPSGEKPLMDVQGSPPAGYGFSGVAGENGFGTSFDE